MKKFLSGIFAVGIFTLAGLGNAPPAQAAPLDESAPSEDAAGKYCPSCGCACIMAGGYCCAAGSHMCC